MLATSLPECTASCLLVDSSDAIRTQCAAHRKGGGVPVVTQHEGLHCTEEYVAGVMAAHDVDKSNTIRCARTRRLTHVHCSKQPVNCK